MDIGKSCFDYFLPRFIYLQLSANSGCASETFTIIVHSTVHSHDECACSLDSVLRLTNYMLGPIKGDGFYLSCDNKEVNVFE